MVSNFYNIYSIEMSSLKRNVLITLGEEVSEHKKEDQSSEEEDELGGLFRMSSMKNIKKQSEKEDMNKEDVSKFNVEHYHDWNLPEVITEYIEF